MKIIPAMDLLGGRCVRLTKGDFDSSISYSDDPTEMAGMFEDAGFDWLHVVDLDGAKTGSSHHLPVLRRIKSETGLHVDFGGGLRSESAISAAFEAGADQVTVGSAAIRDPERFVEWLVKYDAERIILAADVKGGFVAHSGWTETSKSRLNDVLGRFRDEGLRFVLATDIERDGTLTGPAVDLYTELKNDFGDMFVIASGGVGSADDLEALGRSGCDAAIVGKALYEGRISLDELSSDLRLPTSDFRPPTSDFRPPC